MDWLVLIVLLPLLVVPAVLWFGFSGCNWFFGLDETHLTPVPVAPGNLIATLRLNEATNSLEVDLTWENNELSSTVIDYRVERLLDGAPDFEEIRSVPAPMHTDKDVPLDTFVYYRVRASNNTGVGDPSPVVLINTVFITAFDSQNALVTPFANTTAYCLVQRIAASYFQASLGNRKGMIGRIKLRAPANGPLLLDRVYISQPAVANDPRDPGNPAPQAWDSLPATDPSSNKIDGGLAKVFDRDMGDTPLTLLPPTPGDPDSNFAFTKLVTYALDPAHDLLIAMDVAGGSTGNLLLGTKTGATEYTLAATQAALSNRAANAITNASTLLLIESIEVIRQQQP
jgi:hypothetical protein